MSVSTQSRNNLFVIDYRRGVLLVLLAGLCWSSMGIGIRYMESANVWQILFYRSTALAPFLLLIITLRSRGKPFDAIRKAGRAGVIGGLALVIAFTGGVFAIQETSVANAMFLFAAAPFFAALLARMMLGEKVRKGTWIAMFVALAGVIVMVQEGISLGHLNGNISALASALGFAVFTIALRWRKLDDMMPTVLLGGIFTFVTAGIVCLVVGFSFDIPANDISISLTMGVFQVGAGLALYTYGSTAVPAVELALLSTTEVVLGPLWVWLAIGEGADIHTLLGGAVIMAAIVGNAMSGIRRKPVPLI